GADRWIPPESEFALPGGGGGDQVERKAAAQGPAASEEEPVQDGQLRAPRRWERLLVDAAVIGGKDRWRRRLEGLGNELSVRLKEVDEPERENLERTINDLAAFEGYALPLIDALADLPLETNWDKWLDLIGALA